jgi:hypothetical protein
LPKKAALMISLLILNAEVIEGELFECLQRGSRPLCTAWGLGLQNLMDKLLGELPMIARVKANFVNSWQGAVVIARAGERLEHLRKVFRDLKESVSLSC